MRSSNRDTSWTSIRRARALCLLTLVLLISVVTACDRDPPTPASTTNQAPTTSASAEPATSAGVEPTVDGPPSPYVERTQTYGSQPTTPGPLVTGPELPTTKTEAPAEVTTTDPNQGDGDGGPGE